MVLLLLAFCMPSVSATHIVSGDALLAYMEGNATPPYRIWNGTENSSELYAQDIGNADPDWVEIATDPVNFTAIMAIQDTTDDINVQFWNGSWSSSLEVTATGRQGDHSFDVAYENQSGRALIVYNNRQTTPKYRIWSASSWGSEQSAVNMGSEPEDLRLKGAKKRNEIILAARQSDGSIDVQVWNSSAWGNNQTLSTSSSADDTPLAIAYETLSGDALVVWGNLNDDTPNYSIWNGSGWSASANALSIGSASQEPLYMELASHPVTDEITLLTIDDQNDINVQIWNGSGWTNQSELTTTACNNRFCADVIYESKTSRSMVVYENGSNILNYVLWNGSAWSSQTMLANVGEEPVSVDLASHPNKDEILLLSQGDSGVNGNVRFLVWNTTNWVDKGTVGNNLNQNTRKQVSVAYVIPADDPPVVSNISLSSSTVKGGANLTITANNISDLNNGTLDIFCDSSSIPNSSNTDCVGGVISDAEPSYNLTCIVTVASDDANYTVYCRVFDQIGYSHLVNATYTTDSTPPTTIINNVSGDTFPTYIDNVNDGQTNISINGENSMSCRFHTADVIYSNMPAANECSITGTIGLCITSPSQGVPDFYVSCKDSLGNEQNTTQNLDVTDLLVDWAAPTTTDNSVTDVKVPNYTVTITEADNVDADPDTKFCRDTTNACAPATTIDSGGQIVFNESHRGTNYMRYNSTDDAGNNQVVQSKTININRLPLLTSASDATDTAKGGSNITIATVSNETDSSLGQTLFLYVCSSVGANSSGCTGEQRCSNSTGSVNSSCSFTTENDSASHSWFVYVFDDLGEASVNNPISGSYATDSSPPNITILDPANATFSQTSITAQITLNEGGSVALYSLDGAANVSMTPISSTLYTATVSGLSNGVHILLFYANDSYGNMGNSSLRYFTVDTTANDTLGPSIVIISPLNGSMHNSSVLLNISLSENASAAWYSLDGGANTSLGNMSLILWNATITPSQGAHNISFFANDTATNKNTGASAVITFTYDTISPVYSSANATPSPVNTSSSLTCFSSWTDNVQLSVGIVEENATGVFLNHTINFSGASGDLNVTISSANLTPGTVMCNFYMNDTAGNRNSTSVTVVVTDTTPPMITNTTHAPSAVADLDPQRQVNVTANVTDNFNLTLIILQYKEANASEFSNYTMNDTGGNLFNGTFTPTTTNNWTFRILAKDDAGNQNISEETNLSIAYDTTWVQSTTIPSVKSIVQTESRIIVLGNITLNNTGDFPMEFNFSSNASWITFNGTANTSLNLNVSPAEVQTVINITANTTGFAVGLYNYTITVTSNDSRASPLSNSTAAQVNIQNSPGPYLVVTITDYTSRVNKGDTGVAFVSKVENLGTADASGVWLAWEIPSEFTLTSGSQNKSIGNLIIGGAATNSITVSVSSSTDDKNVTINATSNSSQMVGASASKVITIGTPTVVTQSSPGSGNSGDGGGGGGSGGGGLGKNIDKILTGKEIISSEEVIELVSGQEESFPVRVRNVFEGTNLEDITLIIQGSLSQYLTFSPQKISRIPYGETGEFIVIISSPTYLKAGTYDLNMVIAGKIRGKKVDKDLIETRKLTLIVHEISQEAAKASLDAAEDAIEQVKKAGFPTFQITRLLFDAKDALQEKKYERAKEISDKIVRMKETAFDADKVIDDVKEIVEKDKSPVTGALGGIILFEDTENLLRLAQAAFEREDYDTALQRAKEAQLSIAVERGEFNPVAFVVQYWWMLIIMTVLVSATGKVGYKQYQKSTISKKIKDLGVEEGTVRQLMKELQKEYLKKGSMGAATYNEILSQHNKRIAKIRQERAQLRSRRIKLLKSSQILKELEVENKEVMELLRKAQRKYLEKGAISREEYSEQEKRFNERLTEIEDEKLVVLSLTKEKEVR